MTGWSETTALTVGAGVALIMASLTLGRMRNTARHAPAPYVLLTISSMLMAAFLGVRGVQETALALRTDGSVVVGVMLLSLAIMGVIVPMTIGMLSFEGAVVPVGDERDVGRLADRYEIALRNGARTSGIRKTEESLYRKDGIRGWLRDQFTATTAEFEEDEAEGVVKGLASRLFEVVPPVAQARADEIISGLPEVHADLTRERTALDPLENKYDGARRLDELARTAVTRLDDAVSKLRTARSTEYLDLAGNNKAISALSTAQTSSAANAVGEANAAVQALITMMSSQSMDGARRPSDWIDYAMDSRGGGAFDIGSFLSIGKLSGSIDDCTSARTRIEPLVSEAARRLVTAKAARDEQKGRVDTIRAPYLLDAKNELPESVRSFAPTV